MSSVALVVSQRGQVEQLHDRQPPRCLDTAMLSHAISQKRNRNHKKPLIACVVTSSRSTIAGFSSVDRVTVRDMIQRKQRWVRTRFGSPLPAHAVALHNVSTLCGRRNLAMGCHSSRHQAAQPGDL